MDTLEEKMPVAKLAEHYVDRYELSIRDPKRKSDDIVPDKKEEIRMFAQALSRIMKKKKIGESTLWTTIKPDDGGRVISLDFFEANCFGEWSEHIKKYYNVGNEKQFEDDIMRNAAQSKHDYYQRLADEAIKQHNEALGDDYDEEEIGVTQSKVREKGHIMMLEAVYNIFYESFDWSLLERDLNEVDTLDLSGKDPNITAEYMEAKDRLRTFNSYIGKRKTQNPIEKPKKR